MRHRLLIAATVSGTLLLLAPGSASAIVVDGTRDPEYGPPLSAQATQTSFDDNTAGLVYYANGSELDEAYGVIADGALYLFFTGNLASHLVPSDSPDYSDLLLIFLDTVPGGQSVGMDQYGGFTGLRFDPGFEADYFLRGMNVDYRWYPGPQLFQALYESLPTGSTGTVVYLGASTPGGPGTLVGGTNPYGIQAALDDLNTGGVKAGCDAAAGLGVATGIEWAIPLAAIGNPTGCIKVTALISDHDYFKTSNQSLGPMPPGTCTAGYTKSIDFSAIAGDQFFTVCPGATPTRPATWGELKLRYH